MARHLSDNEDNDVDSVINDWLQQACSSLSVDAQPSVLLTDLVASIFLIRDEQSTLDYCLQLMQAICLADKPQVYTVRYCLVNKLYTP